jgi:hypothetical protein
LLKPYSKYFKAYQAKVAELLQVFPLGTPLAMSRIT